MIIRYYKVKVKAYYTYLKIIKKDFQNQDSNSKSSPKFNSITEYYLSATMFAQISELFGSSIVCLNVSVPFGLLSESKILFVYEI